MCTYVQGGGKEPPLSLQDLRDILNSDKMTLKGEPQSGVVDDTTLEKLLDRSHFLPSWDPAAEIPYPLSGVGYRVLSVTGQMASSAVLDPNVGILEAGSGGADPSVASTSAGLSVAGGSADPSVASGSAGASVASGSGTSLMGWVQKFFK